jgi:DNA-packaging protein gp3
MKPATDHRSNRGRPAKYATVEALHEAVYSYFELEHEHPTVTGLALHLGFNSRQSLYDYGRKPQFSYTIKRALLLIESYYEQALFGPNPRGAIFMLKQFGWSDKASRTVNVTAKERPPFFATPSQS